MNVATDPVGEFLSVAETRQATGCARRAAQKRALDAAGIPWQEVRGHLVVSRYHVRAWLEGRPIPASREVNLGAVT